MQKLPERGCGTIQQTKKYFPKQHLQKDKRLVISPFDFAVCGKASITKWGNRGTNATTVCSNMHNAAGVG